MSAGARLRQALQQDGPLVAPGVFNALFARLVEEAQFGAVYLSGAGIANSLLGQPDIGLTSLTETAMVTERITDAVRLPVVVDADTGFGGVANVARTVRTLERAGAAALQLEDQTFPKRCGHFDGKQVVEVTEMLERLTAALDARTDPATMIIARTDAAAPLGLGEAIDRAHQYADAGADALFVEAPRTREDLALVGRELGRHVLVANMVEFGKTPLLPAQELFDLGFRLVIFPGSITRLVVRAVTDLLTTLHAAGTTESLMTQMAHFSEVNSMLGLDGVRTWEAQIAERASGAARSVSQGG
jgi:2-methylisocitrate lyase-like PEP mutase family enzyme